MPSEILQSAIVPSVAGLEACVLSAGLPKKYAPLAAVVIGVGLECLAATYAYHHGPVNYANAVFEGIGLGLAAVGLKAATVTSVDTSKSAASGMRSAALRVAARLPRIHRNQTPLPGQE